MRSFNGLLIVAILALWTSPLYAQRQQQNIAKLKADARDLVGIIGSDKTKTQTYCQILNLGHELDQVDEKDPKKAEDLNQKIDKLEKTLGPEYLALAKGLEHMDPASPEGQEIVSIIESLDKSCEH